LNVTKLLPPPAAIFDNIIIFQLIDVNLEVLVAAEFALNPQLGGCGTGDDAVLSLSCVEGLKFDITMLGALDSIATPPHEAREVFG